MASTGMPLPLQLAFSSVLLLPSSRPLLQFPLLLDPNEVELALRPLLVLRRTEHGSIELHPPHGPLRACPKCIVICPLVLLAVLALRRLQRLAEPLLAPLLLLLLLPLGDEAR